jgi:hypothetical protein
MRRALAIVLVAASGCQLVFPLGGSDDQPVPDEEQPWAQPAIVEGFPDDGDDPSLTSDLLEIYFQFQDDIYTMRRSSAKAPFGPHERVDELSTEELVETTPEVSANGLTIYFARGPDDTMDIYVATRASTQTKWETPVLVPELAERDISEEGPSTTDDGLVMVYQAGDTPFLATRTSDSEPWNRGVAILSIDGMADEESLSFAADGLALYFDSDRTGEERIYRAVRTSRDEPFGLPSELTDFQILGPLKDPWVSPDEQNLFFIRDAPTRALVHAQRVQP